MMQEPSLARSCLCNKKERMMELVDKKRTAIQVLLLLVALAMLYFGVQRGEAEAVLNKAIRLCLECVGIG